MFLLSRMQRLREAATSRSHLESPVLRELGSLPYLFVATSPEAGSSGGVSKDGDGEDSEDWDDWGDDEVWSCFALAHQRRCCVGTVAVVGKTDAEDGRDEAFLVEFGSFRWELRRTALSRCDLMTDVSGGGEGKAREGIAS